MCGFSRKSSAFASKLVIFTRRRTRFGPKTAQLRVHPQLFLVCSKVYQFSPKKVRSRANFRLFALWRTFLLKNPYVFVHTSRAALHSQPHHAGTGVHQRLFTTTKKQRLPHSRQPLKFQYCDQIIQPTWQQVLWVLLQIPVLLQRQVSSELPQQQARRAYPM